MKVHFLRGWFAPGGVRFHKSTSKYDLRDVPEQLRPFLPKTARVIDSPEAPPAPVKETLRDHDTERTGQDLALAKIAAADARRK